MVGPQNRENNVLQAPLHVNVTKGTPASTATCKPCACTLPRPRGPARPALQSVEMWDLGTFGCPSTSARREAAAQIASSTVCLSPDEVTDGDAETTPTPVRGHDGVPARPWTCTKQPAAQVHVAEQDTH